MSRLGIRVAFASASTSSTAPSVSARTTPEITPAVVGRDDHRLVAVGDPARGFEDRPDQLGAVVLEGQAGEVRPDRRRAPPARRVASAAADPPGVEEERLAAAGIPFVRHREPPQLFGRGARLSGCRSGQVGPASSGSGRPGRRRPTDRSPGGTGPGSGCVPAPAGTAPSRRRADRPGPRPRARGSFATTCSLTVTSKGPLEARSINPGPSRSESTSA